MIPSAKVREAAQVECDRQQVGPDALERLLWAWEFAVQMYQGKCKSPCLVDQQYMARVIAGDSGNNDLLEWIIQNWLEGTLFDPKPLKDYTFV